MDLNCHLKQLAYNVAMTNTIPLDHDGENAYLSEALPVSGRALALRMRFNRSLIQSCGVLLDACEDVVSSSLFQNAKVTLTRLNADLKLSGFLSALHVNLFHAIEAENLLKIEEIITHISSKEFQCTEMKILNFSALSRGDAACAQRFFSQEISEDVVISPLTDAQHHCIQRSLEKGLIVYQNAFPNFYREFEELVSEILLLNSQRLKQGSSADLFGMIYKSYQHPWKTVADILDLLVHEQSHLYIYLLNHDDRLILNPMDRFEAPLRKEKRPLIGIFHATFVLARMQYVLKKAHEGRLLPRHEQHDCQTRVTYYQKRFRAGFEVLQKHAQLTPLARQLMTSAKTLLED